MFISFLSNKLLSCAVELVTLLFNKVLVMLLLILSKIFKHISLFESYVLLEISMLETSFNINSVILSVLSDLLNYLIILIVLNLFVV